MRILRDLQGREIRLTDERRAHILVYAVKGITNAARAGMRRSGQLKATSRSA